MQSPSPSPERHDVSANLIVRGRRVITPEGERPAAIHIRGGVIAAILAFDELSPGITIHEAGDSVVMPGLVDTHVHINEPGRTEWEGFTTATRAAAAGGITTLIEMPLNSIPATTTMAAFREKVSTAEGQLWVDTGFWGGIVPGNAVDLNSLWEAGCFGFKCFLVESGVEEFRSVSEVDLRAAFVKLAEMEAPLLAHAELPGPIEEAAKRLDRKTSPRLYRNWLLSRPREAEDQAIEFLLRLANEYRAKIHIVHLSSADAITKVQAAKLNGTRVSVETCPHYVTFASEEIADGATEFKCAPPIREAENREKLWAALGDGTINMIATDHSPCPPEMKRQDTGDFMKAWGGIASLQLSLPAVWTQARARGYSLTHLAKWMCEGPAHLARLGKRKGAIAVGCDADLVIWNPDATFRVQPELLHHRHKLTSYEGRQLLGKIETTFLRGMKIFDGDEFCAAPAGRVLFRNKI
jgi:allantoinase